MHLRLCSVCNVIEDEVHFVCVCTSFARERNELFAYVNNYCSNFHSLNDQEKFIFLFTLEDQKCLTRLGKYLYNSFSIKQNINATIGTPDNI